ncbi:MAG: hypothetical protein AAGA12_13970 [Pseudomonadota bacterium]
MKLKALSFAIILSAGLVPSVAAAFCPADGHREAASCQTGTSWDATLQTCVPDASA